MLNRLKYRLKQYWVGMFACYKKEDEKFAQHYLTIQEMSLFNQLPDFEKKHGVVVARKMLALAPKPSQLDERKLARLGLLHDIGKVMERNTITTKSLLVIIRFIWPKLYQLLAARGEHDLRWRRFYVHRHHGELGAHMLEKIGVSGDILSALAQHDPHANPLYVPRTLEEKLLGQADSTY